MASLSLLWVLWSFLSLGGLLAPGTHARILVQDVPPQAQIYQVEQQSPLATSGVKQLLHDLVYALDVMQDEYFVVWQGTWPSGNDWTRAVMGTHVSAALSSLTATTDDALLARLLSDASEVGNNPVVQDSVALENLVSQFFGQVMTFYFGENAFALRNEAYDDMLWVVLDWLESIKFGVLHSDLHYEGVGSSRSGGRPWHGAQFRTPAAHRVRVFYELASAGWDTTLCGGGMIWSPYLDPYKNAITNELYISASIGMYLYFPGDMIDAPFTSEDESEDGLPHDPVHLQTAKEAYRWLKNSNMTGIHHLYADGFHIRGYQNPENPGTRKCDVLNTMVYTYNQGVILSGLKGLFLATGSEDYLADGHELVQNVMRATGWPNVYNQQWAGLGRAGILEEACDSRGDCSQDGQTFKGIFFHHFTEFCRPLRPQEERFLRTQSYGQTRKFEDSFERHQAWCSAYRPWIERNAEAALVTRNEKGKFGMWWGRRYRVFDDSAPEPDSPLPDGATDYRNYPDSMSPDWRANGTAMGHSKAAAKPQDDQPDYNDRGRGRTVETQAGGVAVLRALYQWRTEPSLAGDVV
ncbi:hypothetical protein BJX61DRAFT_15790 [Aspergillus egyptiacus]|nr:hypothetical protein BJX61DRAFT_15790 [Aspergillus egyptiacus]